jgi:hypothetical protein
MEGILVGMKAGGREEWAIRLDHYLSSREKVQNTQWRVLLG